MANKARAANIAALNDAFAIYSDPLRHPPPPCYDSRMPAEGYNCDLPNLSANMLNFSEAKSILESITDIVKKSATLDLQEKIVSLREFIISIKDENIALKEENQSLKMHLAAEQEFVLRDGMYWKEGDGVPFCQKCLDVYKKRVHLQRWSGNRQKCLECNNVYMHRAGTAQTFRPDYGRHSNR